jgi:integrase
MSQTKFYLTKRDNGFYYICIKYPDGKTEWKTTKFIKELEALHFLTSIEETFHNTKNVQMPTFSEFLRMYEAVQSSVIRKSTIELYKTLADKFLKLNFDKPLNTYTSLEFKQTRAKEIARGLSITRMNMYTRAIKTMFNFALKQNIIAVNPLENVKQIKQSKTTPAFFSFTHLEKLLALVKNQRLKEIFIFAFLTGMRIGEIINLRWVNVDFENNQIRISNSADFTTKFVRAISFFKYLKRRNYL